MEIDLDIGFITGLRGYLVSSVANSSFKDLSF